MKIQQFNNFAVDLKQGILWQYNDATNLLGLINSKQQWYNIYQSGFWGVWHEIVFNLQTADDFGLAIWSIILNVPLLVPYEPRPLSAPTFGFNAFIITDISDTSELSVGMTVSGTGISADTTIIEIPSATSVVVSQPMTDTGTQALTFSLVQSCETTDTSDVLVVEDSSVLFAGMDVSGTGIAGSTTILNILDPTSITLSNAATATGTEDITFSLDLNGDIDTPGLENSYLNFEHSNFSDIDGIVLTVEQQRWLLRLRYFQLTTLGNVAGYFPNLTYSINEFLHYLCEDNAINYNGTIYALDNLDMTMTYHFTDTDFPSPLYQALRELDIFPRPAGVGILYTGLS